MTVTATPSPTVAEELERIRHTGGRGGHVLVVTDDGQTKAAPDPRVAVVETLNDLRARRVYARAGLYAAALAAVRALAVRGIAPEAVGRDVPWPKEFAPLNQAEKLEVVRQAGLAAARRAQVALAVAEASAQ